MKIFLCDLTYNTNRVAAESFPLNVAFVASYCLKKFGSKDSGGKLSDILGPLLKKKPKAKK